MLSARVAANLRRVRERIECAAERAGRDPAFVRLVAVTKYAELEWVRALLDLGCRDLGENRPQQLLERAAVLPDDVRWHLIGHLQRNKVRKVLPVAELIHSVDSLALMADIERIAGELHIQPHVLIEVNLVADPKKHGLLLSDIRTAWDTLRTYVGEARHTATQIIGLMTMAAYTDEPETTRPTFRQLRELRDELGFVADLPHLSMGMTGDFEVAIEEGATVVRIGSALWEGLESAA